MPHPLAQAPSRSAHPKHHGQIRTEMKALHSPLSLTHTNTHCTTEDTMHTGLCSHTLLHNRCTSEAARSHVHPPSPLECNLCAEQAHPAHPSHPGGCGVPMAGGVTPFPIAGKGCELSHTWGVHRAKRTDALLCCARWQKPQGWPCSWARVARLGHTLQQRQDGIRECHNEMCEGGTGGGCEALVCKRLGQAGLAGQVQACAAGARQQHV